MFISSTSQQVILQLPDYVLQSSVSATFTDFSKMFIYHYII